VMIARVVGFHTPEFSGRKQTRNVRNCTIVNAKGFIIFYFLLEKFFLSFEHSISINICMCTFVLQNTASGVTKHFKLKKYLGCRGSIA
jgi:hypothetical protein